MRSRWILIGGTFPKTTGTKGDQKGLSRGGWGQKRTRAKSRPAQAGKDDVRGFKSEAIDIGPCPYSISFPLV